MFENLFKAGHIATAKKAAAAAAATVGEIETKLIAVRANLADAKAHVANQTSTREKLRTQIAALIRDGQLTEAERLGKSVTAASAAIETATINASVYAEVVEETERALIEAEDAAELEHSRLHGLLHGAIRAELLKDVETKWRRAWRHSIAAGARITFDDWIKGVAREAGSLGNHNLTEPMDLGFQEHKPLASSIGFSERSRIRDRISSLREAAEEAAAKAARDAENARRRAEQERRQAEEEARLEASGWLRR